MVNNAGIFLGLNKIVDEPTDSFDKTMVGMTEYTVSIPLTMQFRWSTHGVSSLG